jgi:pilus assembly protein CpaD
VTANLAAQVANPEDLVSPRDQQPVEASSRETMYDKNRKGEATGSKRDDKASGAVSQVVN